MTDSKAVAWVKNFWQLHQVSILALILSALTLPFSFSNYITTALDGSWQRALNIAIKNGARFGTDFVFTYGPLGFVATRNTQYVNNLYLVLADLFLFIGFFYILYKFLRANKGWFFILFVALLYYKGTDYSVSLFLVFSVFSIFCVKNRFKNYFEGIYCVIAGCLSFFIKINYGVIALAILICLAGYLLIIERDKYILFVAAIIATFFSIDYKVKVDYPAYISNSMSALSGFEEAMFVEMPAFDSPFIYALLVFLIYLIGVLVYLIRTYKSHRFDFSFFYTVMPLTLMMFLAYKNGFVRYDLDHARVFFLAIPVLVSFSFLLFHFGSSTVAKIACIVVILFTDLHTDIGNKGKGLIMGLTVSPIINYFSGIGEQKENLLPKELTIPLDKIKKVGNASIDIIPVDIAVLQLNKLNYSPRPIIQSYAAYTPKLDSLNANHFYKKERPKYVMMSFSTIDNRYPMWDESLTKMMLRLNYEYSDHISLSGQPSFSDAGDDYLLLKSKEGIEIKPVFEKLYDTIVDFGDMLKIDFPSNVAVYMTADMEYSTSGKLKKLLYQPPSLYVTLYVDSSLSTTATYRIIKPIVKYPVLINKYIARNTDFINFITGCLHFDKDVKALSITVKDKTDVKGKIKISFMKLSNY
jgi:hypothetical protein